jgi:hypothetical protein
VRMSIAMTVFLQSKKLDPYRAPIMTALAQKPPALRASPAQRPHRVEARPHQVAHRLTPAIRNLHGRQLAGPMQLRQSGRIRRSVLTRSPGRFGISDGATTMPWCPDAQLVLDAITARSRFLLPAARDRVNSSSSRRGAAE